MPWSLSINNLNTNVDVSKLCFVFGKFGRILSANIEHDKNHVSLCKGQIAYDNPFSAFNAFSEMDNSRILGKPMAIIMQQSEKVPGNVKEEYFTKIFVKNIDVTWDDLDLIEAFKVYGEIADAQISMNDTMSNGYGFVVFEKYTSAKKAVAAMDGKTFHDKKLVVKPFVPKGIRDQNKNQESVESLLEKSVQLNNLHVKNLPKSTTESDLIELFKDFGKIQSVKVARDEASMSKGFGFVCFYDEKDASKARDRMNHCSYNSKVLEVNFNQKKAARQKYLETVNSGNQFHKMDNKKDRVRASSSSRLLNHTSRSKSPSKNNIFSFSGKRH